MKIAVSNLKGGSGKSTTSIQLAGMMATEHRVLLVDADVQASTTNWAASRDESPPFVVIGMATATIHRDLPDMADDYDHIIIDCPPRLAKTTRSAIMAADLVLIPLSPSSFDLQAAEELLDLLEDARVINPDLAARFLINRRVVGSSIGNEIAKALKEYDVPLLKSVVSQRVCIAESAAGYLIQEVDTAGKAIREYKALYKEIMKLEG